jgi:hypothetical protein
LEVLEKVRRNLELAKKCFRFSLLSQELVESLRGLERKYSVLLRVPEPSIVTHGTDIETLDEILRDGALLPGLGGLLPVHFSLDTAEWPEDCYIIFPFSENVKVLLRPVFYVPSREEGPLFTVERNNFGIATWDCITYAEVFTYDRFPLEWSSGIYIPPSIHSKRIEQMVKGRIPIVSKPDTSLSRWIREVSHFIDEAINIIWKTGEVYFPEGYIPEFVINYNSMLERIFNMPGGYHKALEEFKILRSARYVYY